MYIPASFVRASTFFGSFTVDLPVASKISVTPDWPYTISSICAIEPAPPRMVKP